MRFWPNPFIQRTALTASRNAIAFWVAGLTLFAFFDAIEAANTGAPVGRTVERLPSMVIRLADLALTMGGLTTGLSLLRSRQILAWFAAGGSPRGLLLGTLFVGAAFTVVLSLVTHGGRPRRAPDFMRDAPAALLHTSQGVYSVEGVAPSGLVIEEAIGIEAVRGQVRRRWTAVGVRWSGDHWQADRLVLHEFFADRIETATRAGAKVDGLEAGPAELVTLGLAGTGRSRGTQPARPAGNLRAEAGLRRRFGLPSRNTEFEAHRAAARPVGWLPAVALGFGVALLGSLRRGFTRPLAKGLLLVFGVDLLVSMAAACVDAALLKPPMGAWVGPVLLATATVTVWRTVLRRGITD